MAAQGCRCAPRKRNRYAGHGTIVRSPMRSRRGRGLGAIVPGPSRRYSPPGMSEAGQAARPPTVTALCRLGQPRRAPRLVTMHQLRGASRSEKAWMTRPSRSAG